jgi:hypothetical protein
MTQQLNFADMVKSLLTQRLTQLGLNPFQLASKIADLRGRKDGKEHSAKALASSIRQVLNNPLKTRVDKLAEIVDALDGEIVVRWKKYKVVPDGVEEIVLPLGNEDPGNEDPQTDDEDEESAD